MLRFSANLGFLWPELPLLKRIDAAAKARFGAVELHWPFETPAKDVRAACLDNGIILLGLNTPVGDTVKGEFGLGALPAREAEFHAAFDQSLAYCVESGARFIHTMAGLVAVDQRTKARDTLLRNLMDAAAKAKTHDLTLLLEPINPRDKPGYFYSQTSEVAAIIADVGADNVKLMFDIYHVAISEGDVLTRFDSLLPIIGHIQIAAVPTRAEPDEGEIAYDRVLARIDERGYRGWIGCEYRPRGDTAQGLTWVQNLGLSNL